MADARAEQAPSEAPRAHEGPHYANASSKPLQGPVAVSERTGTQRWIWNVFFVGLLLVVATGVVLGLVFRG
jgi:hypothetical protein